jgi:hypothetical protein
MNTASRKRLFTVEEANQRLPLVRAIVTDIVKLYEDVHDRRDRLNRVRHSSSGHKTPSMYSEEVQQIEEELEKDIERLEEFANELEELGVELKDPVMGLVDFRTMPTGTNWTPAFKAGSRSWKNRCLAMAALTKTPRAPMENNPATMRLRLDFVPSLLAGEGEGDDLRSTSFFHRNPSSGLRPPSPLEEKGHI